MTPETANRPKQPLQKAPAVLLLGVGALAGLWFVSADGPFGQDPRPVRQAPQVAVIAPAATPNPPPVVTPRWTRTDAPRGRDAETLLALGRSMAMPGQAVEVPCRDQGPEGGCVRHALDAWFGSLDAAAQGKGQSRITVFGNSLIISDRIVDVWRARLQDRFGDAGRGFLYADRQANYGARARTAYEATGFVSHNVVWGERGRYPHGIGGALHVARSLAKSRWSLEGASRARLMFLDHVRAPDLQVLFAGGATQSIAATHRGTSRVVDLALDRQAPPATVELVAPRGAVIYGVTFERAEPGVILDNMSIIGADSTRFLRIDEAIFTEQMRALSPNLVTVLLGGNEVKRVAWGGSTLKKVERDLRAFLQRIRTVAPEASCLVTGPLENVHGAQPTKVKSTEPVKFPWKKRWQTDAVAKIMHDVTIEQGCAYFDTFAAMGGPGALRRLHQKGLLNKDMIHPQGQGLDLLGDLINDALLDAYEGAAQPAPRGSL